MRVCVCVCVCVYVCYTYTALSVGGDVAMGVGSKVPRLEVDAKKFLDLVEHVLFCLCP